MLRLYYFYPCGHATFGIDPACPRPEPTRRHHIHIRLGRVYQSGTQSPKY